MKRLVLFIEPAGAQLNIFTQFTLPRLGSFILAGLVNRRDGWSARVFIEGRQRFDLKAWMTEHGRPEVVGISNITATVQRGYALADECRSLGIPVQYFFNQLRNILRPERPHRNLQVQLVFISHV